MSTESSPPPVNPAAEPLSVGTFAAPPPDTTDWQGRYVQAHRRLQILAIITGIVALFALVMGTWAAASTVAVLSNNRPPVHGGGNGPFAPGQGFDRDQFGGGKQRPGPGSNQAPPPAPSISPTPNSVAPSG